VHDSSDEFAPLSARLVAQIILDTAEMSDIEKAAILKYIRTLKGKKK